MTTAQNRLRRRGVMLLLFAFLWSWLITGDLFWREPRPVEGLFHTLWPSWLRALEWFGAAGVAAFFAWKTRDWPGYAALMIPPLLRAGSFMWGWIVWLMPGGAEGYANGWWSALFYLAVVGLVVVASGWPESPSRASLKQIVTGAEETS